MEQEASCGSYQCLLRLPTGAIGRLPMVSGPFANDRPKFPGFRHSKFLTRVLVVRGRSGRIGKLQTSDDAAQSSTGPEAAYRSSE